MKHKPWTWTVLGECKWPVNMNATFSPCILQDPFSMSFLLSFCCFMKEYDSQRSQP